MGLCLSAKPGSYSAAEDQVREVLHRAGLIHLLPNVLDELESRVPFERPTGLYSLVGNPGHGKGFIFRGPPGTTCSGKNHVRRCLLGVLAGSLQRRQNSKLAATFALMHSLFFVWQRALRCKGSGFISMSKAAE